jgi:hypothetical protein
LVNIISATSLSLPASSFSLSAIQSSKTGTNKGDTLLGTNANGITDADFLGLAQGLQFADLQLFQQGSSTVLQSEGQRLAILENVTASSLTADNFVQIGFVAYEGITVPNLV